MGKRRYAMTCRFVDPDLIEDEAARQKSLQAGQIPARAADFQYDGF